MRVKKQTLHFPKTRHILLKIFYKKNPQILAKSFVYASCGCVICFMCTSFFFPYVAKKRLFLMEVSWLYSITSCNKSDNMTFITQTTTGWRSKAHKELVEIHFERTFSFCFFMVKFWRTIKFRISYPMFLPHVSELGKHTVILPD